MLARISLLGLALIVATGFGSPKLSLPVQETGPMTVNFVQGYSFDPLVAQPELPAYLSAPAPSGEYGYYMLQFPGPVRLEWKTAVRKRGVELLWYVPSYAFIARIPTASAGVVAAMPEVRWLAPDQPAWKLFPGLEQTTGWQRLIVVFYYPENEASLVGQLRGLGATSIVTEFNKWNKSVRLDVDASAIPAIARLPGVHWIEPYTDMTLDNQDVQWVDQHGYSATDTTRTIWRKGVSGRGVIIGLTDTPMWMNHNATRDTAGGNTPGPAHRKVVAYRGTQGSDAHGTHTSGTIVGNDDYVGGTSWHDGLAKNARLFFQNYQSLPTNWDMNTWWRGPDSGLNIAVDSLRALNHSMSLSRKDTYNIYVFTDMTADQFIWSHRKFLHCNSMGNFGTNQMGHPVMAKDIISTGGTQNGTSCRNIYTSTSRGPTSDGRRKPQLVSPAENVYSNSNSSQNGYVSMSGTSMATPNMTASMGLIRNYFRKGFYPTGDTLTGTPMEISAALNKTVAIVGADNDVSGYTVPDNNVGWGRVDLDSSLYFAGDSSQLWVKDETLGLETGDSAVYTIDVSSGGRPFRVALCWSDYPGTMRAALILVNNLDLTVISPVGDTYKGSVYSGGQSQTGGIYDTLNVEECVRRNAPAIGTWTIKVKARNVPEGPQPFALAAIGTFGPPPVVHDVGTTAILAPTGTVDSGTTVTPAAVIRNFGNQDEDFLVRFLIGSTYEDSLDLSLMPGESDTFEFEDWDALELGVFPVRCTTELAGDANPANDQQRDSVRVIPPTGIEEKPGIPAVFSLENAVPNPFSRKTAVRYVLPRQARVSLTVYSAAGTLVRRLVDGSLPAGSYSAVWDGCDARGLRTGTGIYLLRFETGSFAATRKLVIER